MNFAQIAGLLIAQAAPAPGASSGATTAPADAVNVPIIALKRWYGSLTLSSPEGLPSYTALWALLAGLGALLFVALVVQGPRGLLQFLDLAGLARVMSAGAGRLRRSTRLLAILLGATVVSWTAWQAPLHNRAEKKEELTLLMKTKSRAELSIEQGALAALTPFRDVMGLGDMVVLLVGAAALVFKFSADRWGRFDAAPIAGRPSLSGWTTVCWAGAGLYAMYRIAGLIVDLEGLPPLGGCLFPEIGAVPLLMLLSDGLLLAWVLTELRGAYSGDEEAGFDVVGAITIVPAAMLACLVGMPARYMATTAGLAFFHHLPPKLQANAWLLMFLRGWGLVALQAGSIALVGLAAAVPWSRGTWGSALAGYGRVLRASGGRLAAVLALVGLLIGSTSALAYYAVLAMPVQPWVLLAADSYAHYASLPIGLVGLAALVELGAGSAARPKGDAREDVSEGVTFANPGAA